MTVSHAPAVPRIRRARALTTASIVAVPVATMLALAAPALNIRAVSGSATHLAVWVLGSGVWVFALLAALQFALFISLPAEPDELRGARFRRGMIHTLGLGLPACWLLVLLAAFLAPAIADPGAAVLAFSGASVALTAYLAVALTKA